MQFIKTGQVNKQLTKIDKYAEEIGFFKIDKPYTEVVFLSDEGTYFNGYGEILKKIGDD